MAGQSDTLGSPCPPLGLAICPWSQRTKKGEQKVQKLIRIQKQNKNWQNITGSIWNGKQLFDGAFISMQTILSLSIIQKLLQGGFVFNHLGLCQNLCFLCFRLMSSAVYTEGDIFCATLLENEPLQITRVLFTLPVFRFPGFAI
jgi:hypothetical protein